jgi:hypothetical protein
MAAVQSLHKTINAVASRMEQQAGHAGLEGANPTAYPGGYPTYGSVRFPRGSSTRAVASTSAGNQSNSTSNPAVPEPAGSAALSGKV